MAQVEPRRLAETQGHQQRQRTPGAESSSRPSHSYPRIWREILFLYCFTESHCLVLRFLDGCRKKKRHASSFLTTQELIRSKECLLQVSQRESYPDVISLLSRQQPLPLKHPLITLQPVLEDGMLRVRGRAGQANFSQSRIHPTILSSNSPITKLLVHQAHLQA